MYMPQYVLLRVCLGGMDYYLAQPPPTDFSDFTSTWLLWGLRADCAALCRRGQVRAAVECQMCVRAALLLVSLGLRLKQPRRVSLRLLD